MRPGRALRALAEAPETMPVTSLIDITFLLLIFFLLTMKFRSPEAKLAAMLPPDRGLAQPGRGLHEDLVIALRVPDADKGQPPKARRVEVTRGRPAERLGTLALSDPDGTASASPPRLLDDLGVWVRQVRSRAPDLRVRLDVDASTPHALAVAVLDALAHAGITDVAFGGFPRRFAADVLRGKTPK